MDNDGTMIEQRDQKTQIQADAFVKLVIDRGLIGDKSIKDEHLREARQIRLKKAYHNTLLLLQNYRTIAWVVECFPDEVEERLDRPFTETDGILELVDLEMSMDNRKLESRLAGIQKSRLLIDRMNEALTMLRKKPDNGQKLYDLINLTYIAPEVLVHREILYRLNLSSRQYYRLREQAVAVLSIRLWSSPAAEMDRLLDILTLMEDVE